MCGAVGLGSSLEQQEGLQTISGITSGIEEKARKS
jgi:hypothetical protein